MMQNNGQRALSLCLRVVELLFYRVIRQRPADVFFKMQGNTSVPEHWHHSAERMVLITGEMEVEYESQDPAVLKPGTYAYGPPQHPHEASCLSEEPCVLFIAFEEPVDAFQANK